MQDLQLNQEQLISLGDRMQYRSNAPPIPTLSNSRKQHKLSLLQREQSSQQLQDRVRFINERERMGGVPPTSDFPCLGILRKSFARVPARAAKGSPAAR